MSVHAGVFSSLIDLMGNSTDRMALVDTIDHSAIQTDLLSATQIDPVAATGGGDVFVSDGALISTGPIAESEKAASKNGGEISVYTVREGDSLSQIAEMYSVTTNTILWANDISKASSIRPGDTLVILPIVGVRHTVTGGETLSTILKKYEADLDEVLEYNHLTSDNVLAVGDEIMIPGGSIHTTTKVTARPTPTKSSGTVSTSGYFSHPVPGAIRTQGIHGYNGIDLAAAYGASIRAAASGEVIVSKSGGWNGGYGSYIVVKHGNGTQTLYAHLSGNNVSVGNWVSQGEIIGAMGSTGRSTGTHLHFEVRGGSNPF